MGLIPLSHGERAGVGGYSVVFHQLWPVYDPKLLVAKTMTIVVQVNGKVRANIELPADATKEDVIAAAKRQENVTKHVGGRDVKKEVYVPGKLINFVLHTFSL